jgi:anti-anti-sigma factor
MSTTAVSVGDIKADGFSAHTESRTGAIVVSLRGNADMAVHERLKAFLDAVGQSAKSVRPKEVVFELEDLYFMNSSCLSLLLRFLNSVLELPTPQQYKARFRSNPNLRWQKKSLKAIQAYAKELVILE